MANYQDLKARFDQGDTIILDGAIGTQLQDMGVPMHPVGWCGPANLTHPGTVELMHERYIKAGADVITTNTFSTNRPKMEGSGYGDSVQEANIQAVRLAQEARDRVAVDRPVYIAGSISEHMGRHDTRSGVVGSRSQTSRYTAAELRAYYDEWCDILAEAGVDFFLVEFVGHDNEARVIATETAKKTGLPFWVGLTTSQDPSDRTALLRIRSAPEPSPLEVNVREIDRDKTLATAIRQVVSFEPDVMSLFHARVTDITAGLDVLKEEWPGLLGAWPDAGRLDYTVVWQDRNVPNVESVDKFTEESRKWSEMGVQVVGGCCGFGVDYIEPLRGALPDRISAARAG